MFSNYDINGVRMEKLKANILINKQMILGEGPVWNDYTKRLNFVDIEGKRVYEYNLKNKALYYAEVGDRVSCIVPTIGGDLVAGVTDKLVLIDSKTKMQSAIKDFNLPEEIRFNDGKCDKKGRFLVGTMAIDQNAPYAKICGNLYSYEKGERMKALLFDQAIPNGLAFSKDNRILYHIDTATQKIMAYPYDLDTGNISNGSVVIEFSKDYGSPDGMCIDEFDNLWVALWGGYKVACVDTKLKKVIKEIKVDAKYVSCCAFGGENLDELFITTAMDEDKNGGQVFYIKLNVKGTLPYECKMGEQYGNKK